MAKKKNKKRIKDTSQHAINRARERYGLNLSKNDLQRIAALIRDGCALSLGKESNSRSHFVVRYQEQYLYTVYGNLIKTVHTFLPATCIDDSVLKKIDKFPHW